MAIAIIIANKKKYDTVVQKAIYKTFLQSEGVKVCLEILIPK
jgi:hypothetical protein